MISFLVKLSVIVVIQLEWHVYGLGVMVLRNYMHVIMVGCSKQKKLRLALTTQHVCTINN